MEVTVNSRAKVCDIAYERDTSSKMFAIINTTDYPSDKFGVITCPFIELGYYGFSREEIDEIQNLCVGESFPSGYYEGCIVIRIG